MAHDDSSVLATKQDLQILKDDILLATKDEVRSIFKEELIPLIQYVGLLPTKEEMNTAIAASEGRMLTAIENLRHDMNVLHEHHSDKITNHEKRVHILEIARSTR